MRLGYAVFEQRLLYGGHHRTGPADEEPPHEPILREAPLEEVARYLAFLGGPVVGGLVEHEDRFQVEPVL